MICFVSLFCAYYFKFVQERRLKELFDDIPTFYELRSLELEGIRADVILVDGKKDKKLSMIKQLTVALVKGLNSNPAAKIKKIARLVGLVFIILYCFWDIYLAQLLLLKFPFSLSLAVLFGSLMKN